MIAVHSYYQVLPAHYLNHARDQKLPFFLSLTPNIGIRTYRAQSQEGIEQVGYSNNWIHLKGATSAFL